MDHRADTLNIAEVPYDTGEIQFRYGTYMSDDGSRWIRHGLFVAYHRNGNVSSEGNYSHGVEEGLWRDFHENGLVAAEGVYRNGKEHGIWRYWSSEARPEPDTIYSDGVEVTP